MDDANIQTLNVTDAERWLQDCLLRFACPVPLCQRSSPSVPQCTRSPTSPSPRAPTSSPRPRAPSTSLSPCADPSTTSTADADSNNTDTVPAASAPSCPNSSLGGNTDDPFDDPHMASLVASSNVPSTLDHLQSTLPTHLQDLFDTTCQSPYLPTTIIPDIHDLLMRHQHTFATSSTDLGFCDILQHDIDTGDSHPIKQSHHRPPFAARETEDKILDEMITSGVIEPSQSPWASPVCLVKKKDDTYRFCIDYRRVNAISKKDAFPIPDIHDALDHLRGARYFATFDLLSGY